MIYFPDIWWLDFSCKPFYFSLLGQVVVVLPVGWETEIIVFI